MGNVISRGGDDNKFGVKQSINQPTNAVFNDLSGSSNSITDSARGKRAKKRKLLSEKKEKNSAKLFKLDTPKYVYQKLFIEGCDSDVVIHALGMKWRLHRVYLEQCDYFRALFHGNWSDSFHDAYTLEIVDNNITYSGLNNVFASLYNNEIEIDNDHIAGVIGAATMLNLTSVLNRCTSILFGYLSNDNILFNLRLSELYGFSQNVNNVLEYLKFSFWRYSLKISFLRDLEHDWFVKILSSDILCVRENELDLYLAIKNWIYLKHFPDEEQLNNKKMIDFFNSSDYNWLEYADILRYLRVSQLTLLLKTTKIVKQDSLIPKGILDWVMRDQWNTLLINEEATSPLDESVDDDFFYRHCFRLGRCGNSGCGKTMWRWLGCFFGTDLLANHNNGTIRLIRNCGNIPAQQSISIKMCDVIRIHYRVIVSNEESGKILFDSKHCHAFMGIDNIIKIGVFEVPKEKFSIHVFYLASIPGPSSTYYWDNFVRKQNGQKLDASL